jgi:hypothetical protein
MCSQVNLLKRQAVKSQIAEAQKLAAGTGSEQDIAEAKIELEVCYSGFAAAEERPLIFFTFSMNRFWRACKTL